MQRDGDTIAWGLRAEDIPMNTIEWVLPSSELSYRLKLPWLYWPGAVIGARNAPGGKRVEFLASRSRGLVLIAAADRIFAISPEDPQAFLQAFQGFMEMGSLSPLPPALFTRAFCSPACGKRRRRATCCWEACC